MNFAWELPLRQNILIRGWQLAGSGTVYSGQPFTPQLSGPSNDLAQATRPDRIANGALPNPSPDLWFDLNAFPIVPDSAFRYGNSGRNILGGPSATAINLALSRFFRVGERGRFAQTIAVLLTGVASAPGNPRSTCVQLINTQGSKGA